MKSKRGGTPDGVPFNPQDLPEESADTAGAPRPAPGPGLPISKEEFDRLKEAAKHAPAPRVENAQEDQPDKNQQGKRRR